MEDKIEFEHYFGAKIDPAIEEFVRHVMLYCLHENHYILLEPMDIKKPVQLVGDTVRIYRHNCRNTIMKIMNGMYPGNQDVTMESHRKILYHFFLWFYAQKWLITHKRIFIIVAAFAMEVIYTVWEIPDGEEFIKATFYILASVFSGREFKRYLQVEHLQNYAEYFTKKNIEDFRNVENQYFRHKDDVRRQVSMDYLAMGAAGSAESLSSISDEIKASIKVYAEKSKLFVNLLEQCNTKEAVKKAQSQLDEEKNFLEGLTRVTADLDGFISQVRQFISGANK